MQFVEQDNQQVKEAINTAQRFAAWSAARERLLGYRGSMLWATTKGTEYLRRSYYDRSGARRKQTSLGPRSPDTEKKLVEFEKGRASANERFEAIDAALARQAAINRAIGLGRVPLIAAKILRAIEDAGLLGSALRIVGTNALFAYEAAAGGFFSPDVVTTEDIDILLNARSEIRFVFSPGSPERSILSVLRKADRSFERAHQDFRAVNSEGYLVDLIKPMLQPPWKNDADRPAEHDLQAAMIEGLSWLENAPPFTATVIDASGRPAPIVTVDPRVFAAHKFWLSQRPDRHAAKRRRDEAQARAVAQVTARYFPHLPYEAGELRMLPKPVFQAAAPLFREKPPQP